jgi:hypothetical protein
LCRSHRAPRRARHREEHAAKSDLHAGQILQLIEEDGLLLGFAVAIGVFKHLHAVDRGGVPLVIRIALGDPELPAIIRGQRDRLRKDGLRGDLCHSKSF